MKRPEGFDQRQAGQKPEPRQKAQKQPTKQPARTAPVGKAPVRLEPAKALRKPPVAQPTREHSSQRERAGQRRAARARRRYERSEIKRFTRRARSRRIAWLATASVMVTLAGVVATAVYSPLLALRTIEVEGASRVSADEIHAAVDGQLGTPLALVDFDAITEALGQFPLIRSYVTEIVPPDTMLIHVEERQPVGSILSGAVYELVDPAGIVVQSSVDRIPGVPLIELAGNDTSSAVFESVVEVLLALPPSLLPQVDSITARSKDDVSLVLTGIGQRVSWGSAERSAQKAVVLAALVAVTDPRRPGEFDVSAPGNAIFAPG